MGSNMKLCSNICLVLAVMLIHVYESGAKYDWKTKQVSNGENHFIFKGTKWCGRGNNAMSFDDLGTHVQTDTCCREHDHCPSTIPSFSRRFGILNYYPMHMSHCSCENRLFNCLWNITSPVSVAVGRLYFNVFRAPCFQLVEVKVCKKRSFNWKKFKFVCKEYGVELKGKTFKLRKFLKEFPLQPDMNSTRNMGNTKPIQSNPNQSYSNK